MLNQGKQVAMIAGHQCVNSGLDRTGEDQIIVGVATDGLRLACRGGDEFGREIDEQLLDRLPAPWLEADLLGQVSSSSTITGRGRTISRVTADIPLGAQYRA